MNRTCLILGLSLATLGGCSATTQTSASPGALESTLPLLGAGDALGMSTYLELSHSKGDMTALECLVYFEQCELEVPTAILTAAEAEFRILAGAVQAEWSISGTE